MYKYAIAIAMVVFVPLFLLNGRPHIFRWFFCCFHSAPRIACVQSSLQCDSATGHSDTHARIRSSIHGEAEAEGALAGWPICSGYQLNAKAAAETVPSEAPGNNHRQGFGRWRAIHP